MQALQQTVVALRLRHPNIVTVMGTSVDPPTGNLLLVTALLERGTLYDLLHNDTVSPRFLCSLGRSLTCLTRLTHSLTPSSIHAPVHASTHPPLPPWGAMLLA